MKGLQAQTQKPLTKAQRLKYYEREAVQHNGKSTDY